MQIWHKLTLLTLALALAAGCAQREVWFYRPIARPVAGGPLLDKTVAVPPFLDARPNSNGNYRFFGFIPLMPFGWQDLDRPESALAHLTTTFWLFKPSDDLARAVASELASARLFREAAYTYGPVTSDLVFQGKLVSTRFKGLWFTYGLSLLGESFWVLGLPAARVRSDLELEYVLKDARTGEAILQGSYAVKQARLAWVYSMYPDFDYNVLATEMARMIVGDLDKTLREKR